MRKIATLRGYTAQARYYANRMACDESGDWIQMGWMSYNGGSKPVFRLKNGLRVVILGDCYNAFVWAITDMSLILPNEADCFAAV